MRYIGNKTKLLPAIEEALRAGRMRIVSLFDAVNARKIPREEVARFDPSFGSFRNINTPEEYFRFREEEKVGDEGRSGSSPPGGTRGER